MKFELELNPRVTVPAKCKGVVKGLLLSEENDLSVRDKLKNSYTEMAASIPVSLYQS